MSTVIDPIISPRTRSCAPRRTRARGRVGSRDSAACRGPGERDDPVRARWRAGNPVSS
jgi:hypothetical protein